MIRNFLYKVTCIILFFVVALYFDIVAETKENSSVNGGGRPVYHKQAEILRIKQFSPNLKWMQDAALYKNTLFIATGYNNFYVFDWKNQVRLGGPFIWGAGDKLHCNAISFGAKRKKSDLFPALYCSVGNDDRGCYVYSIAKDYVTEKIQTIRVGFINDSIWRGEPKSDVKGRDSNGYFVVDNENKFLYAVITRATGKNTAAGRVFKFALPDLSHKTVILHKSDILEFFDFPFYPVLQGLHINKGILYITSGFYKIVENEYYFVAIDLAKKTEIWRINMSDIFREMEGAWTDKNNRLYFSGYDTNGVTQVYRLIR